MWIPLSVLIAFLGFTPSAPAEQVTREGYSFVVPESCDPLPQKSVQNFEERWRKNSSNDFPNSHFLYFRLSSGETRRVEIFVVKWYSNGRMHDEILESMPRIKVKDASAYGHEFPSFPKKRFDDSTNTIWEDSEEYAPLTSQKATRVTEEGSLQVQCISNAGDSEAMITFHQIVKSIVISPEMAYKHRYSLPPSDPPQSSAEVDQTPSGLFPTFLTIRNIYLFFAVVGLASLLSKVNQRSPPSRPLSDQSTIEFLDAVSLHHQDDVILESDDEDIPKPS